MPLGRLGGWAIGDSLTIEVRHEQDYVIVTVAGEIDISTVSRMRECLFDLAASGRPLVADLDQVSFIDSTGLAALVGTAKRAAACGGRLYAVCSRPTIRQLFGLTGLDSRIPLASTLDETLEALAAARATS
jgi:anti-anti-sigma factor